MIVHGLDFTSTPSRRKPIVSVTCRLDGERLTLGDPSSWFDLIGFENFLLRPGPWIAGLDFPFGQARRFIENIDWPRDWASYVTYAGSLSRVEFRAALDAYRAARMAGDREHRRQTDVAAGAISPQKLYGVPVALMFHEGAPRLLRAGVTVPGLHAGDPHRVAVEAYPGVLARYLVGRRRYKSDSRQQQDVSQRATRVAIVDALAGDRLQASHGVRVVMSSAQRNCLVDEPMGDALDAVLCAVQAAWCWQRRHARFGQPENMDRLEGWIAEPSHAPSRAPSRQSASPHETLRSQPRRH